MPEEEVFSIITCYLHLSGREEKILAFRADEYYWRDLGSPDNLAQAAQDLKQLSAQAEAHCQANRPSGNRLKAER